MKGNGKLVPRTSNFFVEMDASSVHTMNIPKKFAKMWKGHIRENIELEGPSRITWHVKMIKLSNNTFATRSGWKEFVIANQIDKNDVLVFTYYGNSSFKVMIFDRSACERDAPFFVRKMETETESEESNDSLIREIVAPHSEVKKVIISLSSGNTDTDESSRDISSRAARVHRTGERDCGKWKQRVAYFVQESSKSESESDSGTVRKRKIKENKAKKASRPNYTQIRRGPPPATRASRGTTGNAGCNGSDANQTFWTICQSCGMRYQYYKTILEKALRCPYCLKPFIAYDMNEQANPSGAGTGNDVKPNPNSRPNPSNGPSNPEQSPGGPTSASTSTGTQQAAAQANATNMLPVKSNKRKRKFVIEQEEGSDNSTDSSDGEDEIVLEPKLTKKYKEEIKEEREDSSDGEYEYQAPEFYNFGNDRGIEKFKPGQTWALYSDTDKLPKYYASVKRVDLEKKTVHISWLEPSGKGVAGEEKRWIDLDLPLGCGTFAFGSMARYNNTEMFSHEVATAPVPGKKNLLEIVPVKTETWAVYRNWKIGWSLNDITKNCQYDLVRVSYVTRTWIEVLYLAKVAGHRTVFKMDYEKKSMKIAKGEFLRFSHKIPAHWLSDEAGCDLICWELDPAAFPDSLLS